MKQPNERGTVRGHRAAIATFASSALGLILGACSHAPAPPHRLVGTWEFSADRTRALSRTAAEQFHTPDLGPMHISIGADGTFSFVGDALSKHVPVASRWELVEERGEHVTIRVTRPDKAEPETIHYTFSGADELHVEGQRLLVFHRGP